MRGGRRPGAAGCSPRPRDHADRVSLEKRERREIVRALGRPTYELPRLADGIDLGALHELADLLTDQGMA